MVNGTDMSETEKNTKQFLIALNKINAENLAFFLIREPKFKEDEMDKLENHYRFEVINGTAYFGFHDDSDLPDYIRKKCLVTFDHFFPEGKIFGHMLNH